MYNSLQIYPVNVVYQPRESSRVYEACISPEAAVKLFTGSSMSFMHHMIGLQALDILDMQYLCSNTVVLGNQHLLYKAADAQHNAVCA